MQDPARLEKYSIGHKQMDSFDQQLTPLQRAATVMVVMTVREEVAADGKQRPYRGSGRIKRREKTRKRPQTQQASQPYGRFIPMHTTSHFTNQPPRQ